jgi:hypothetical protein
MSETKMSETEMSETVYIDSTRGDDLRASIAATLMGSLKVGDRVEIRDGHWWPETDEIIHYYPGTVLSITDEGIEVEWDQGELPLPRLVTGQDIAWMRPLAEAA